MSTFVKNLNEIYADRFQLIFQKIPNTTFFCSSIILPDISQIPNNTPTPLGTLFHSGGKINFGALSVNFRVDEDFTNYKEIYNWLLGTTTSITFDNHKNLVSNNGISYQQDKNGNIFSDGSIVILKNVMTMNKKISFKNLFPIELSGIQFNQEDSTTIITASATFQLDYFEFDD